MSIQKISISNPAKNILNKVEQKSHNLHSHIETHLQKMDKKIPENSVVKITAPKILNLFVDTIKLSLFKEDKKQSSTKIFFPKKIPQEFDQKTFSILDSTIKYSKKYVNLRNKIYQKIANFSHKIN